MFDKLRQVVSKTNERLAAAAKLPPDPKAVPAVAGRAFGDIDVAVMSAYLGRPVESVTSLDGLGPQATSLLGEKLQARLRAAGGGPSGELLPGLDAARLERLRAEGMTEEQLAMVQDRIGAVRGEHAKDGWNIEFAGGLRASVQLFPSGSEAWDDYDRLEQRWDAENGTDGHRPSSHSALASMHHRFTQSPYESYEYKGRLIARNATHAAVAQGGRVDGLTLAAIAALALRTTEAPQ